MAGERKVPDVRRREMPKQSPEIRSHNFDEVALGYDMGLAVEEAKRCLGCKKPLCESGCPVGIEIRDFVGSIAAGDTKRAIEVLWRVNDLPAVCGRVCPQETQCEEKCVLVKKGGQISIGRLERYAADWAAANSVVPTLPDVKPTGRKVAVVGAGPAGITVAGNLARMGHDVVVFEALHEPGGVLTYGIPGFRLPKDVVAREVEGLKRLGVKVVLDFVVGKTRTIEELMTADGFDAVFVGSGAGLPWFMEIPGEELNGVLSANEYLTRVNLMSAFRFPRHGTPVERPRRAAIVGGGNVAMDSARTAKRLGAEEVHVVYRRSREEMPARAEEIENAEEEGVVFDWLTLPLRYIGNDEGHVVSMECQKMALGEPDASGRRRPVPQAGSEFITPVDLVVCAIGNSPNPLIAQTTPDLKIGKKGNIEIDPKTGRTTMKGVFAGGDVATGAATVILAMGAGRSAAASIDEYLRTGVWDAPAKPPVP